MKDYPNLWGVELEFKPGSDIAKAIEETIHFSIRNSDISNVSFRFNGELYKVKRYGEIMERSKLWKQFEEWSNKEGASD